MTVREKVLNEARECVSVQRQLDYGTPEDNFTIIANLWSAYTGSSITALDVAMMMALMKVGRIRSGGGTGDSFVDLAGYAACGAEIKEKMEAKK